ncbi:MAG: ATP-binding protein [Coriobacteriales bacterium]|jgi:hypothetical protein|nr:ATP-binding protein [Coriobacteriales bacterium]
MGIYLNRGSDGFKRAVASEIYVDKTGLIAYANSVIGTEQQFFCVSRPRRFGKSMGAETLNAYYDCSIDSHELFAPFEIVSHSSFEQHINKYDVIFIDMQSFLSKAGDISDMLAQIDGFVGLEVRESHEDVRYRDKGSLTRVLEDVHAANRRRFVLIIDEWDCVFREKKYDLGAQKKYLDYLRDLMKGKTYLALAYMTGILPIKKYGAHSALNMFDEFSMTYQDVLAHLTGFTQEEVEGLCARYGRNIADMEAWYNGYLLEDRERSYSIYSPRSVVKASKTGRYDNYWTETETYEALRIYIDMDYDGLRDKVTALVAGESLPIDTTKFQNDMTTFSKADDILTLLIHLGYLGYDSQSKKAFVPNQEVREEFKRSMEDGGWPEVIAAVKASKALLEAVWAKDEDAVAAGIQAAHLDTAHITYNSEAALSYTISLALYAARDYYTLVRELPTGKGFADIVFIPRPNRPGHPAMLVELKWDKDVGTAMTQIREKRYPDSLAAWAGDILLVGVTYDKDTREHDCAIRQVQGSAD